MTPISEESISALLTHIPSLKGSNWTPTSPSNPSYNCFAWAIREHASWVEPPGTVPYRCWPHDLPDFLTVGNYVRAYERLGFEVCGSADLEPEIEKIALFGDERGMAMHASRQLPSGRWTSKWGRGIDFEHDLDAINGDPSVGSIAEIMKRPFPGPPPPPPPGLVVVKDMENDDDCISTISTKERTPYH